MGHGALLRADTDCIAAGAFVEFERYDFEPHGRAVGRDGRAQVVRCREADAALAGDVGEPAADADGRCAGAAAGMAGNLRQSRMGIYGIRQLAGEGARRSGRACVGRDAVCPVGLLGGIGGMRAAESVVGVASRLAFVAPADCELIK